MKLMEFMEHDDAMPINIYCQTLVNLVKYHWLITGNFNL